MVYTDLMQRFGPFEVDFANAELRRYGVRVRIQEQPLRILEALIEQPGETITREQLRDRLWPSDTFVDFEGSMNAAIAKLRQTLHDSATQPHYVETVARKGYRFIAPVTDDDPPAETIVEQNPVSIPAAPARPNRSNWRLALGILVAGLIAAAVLAGVLRRPSGDTGKPLIWLDIDVGGDVSQPVISSDGSRIVFIKGGRLALRRLDQPSITPLAGTDGASSPFLSPDGHWVGFFADHKLKKVPLDGGEPTELCAAAIEGGGTWLADGQIIAAVNDSGELSRISSTGGPPVAFSSLKGEPSQVTRHYRPWALPGDKGVLFIAGDGLSVGSLRVMPSAGGPQRTLGQWASMGRYLVSGHLVYYLNGRLFAAPMNLEQLTLTGSPMPLVESVTQNFLHGAEFDISVSGTLVYRRSPRAGGRVVVSLDASGAKVRLLAKSDSYVSPRLSPDGKRLAVASASEGPQRVWIHDIGRGTMTPLHFDSEGTTQCCPVWSPDGEYVAFTVGSKNGAVLTVARWDGSGVAERLRAENSKTAVPFSFSPDGKWLVYHSFVPKTGYDIFAVPVDRSSGALRLGKARPLVQQAGFQTAPYISPDGRFLAYGSDESGRFEIYVIPFSPEDSSPKGKWQMTTDGGRGSRWSASGDTIFYRSPDEHLMARTVRVAGGSLVAGKPRLWFSKRLANVGAPWNFDVARDGKTIVALLDDEEATSEETHLRVILNVDDELRRRNKRSTRD